MAQRTRELDWTMLHIRPVELRNLRYIDWLMPLLVLSLAIAGWMVLYSASINTGGVRFSRQIMFFFIGVVLTAGIICVDNRLLVALAPLMYVIAVGALVAVLAMGTEVKGSERWLVLGPFRLQPSEQTKLVVVYALTWYLSLTGGRIRKLHYFLLTFAIVALPILLILKQPNLGTAACIVPVTLVMLWVAGCRWWHMAVIVIAGLSIFPLVAMQMANFDPDSPPPPGETESWELKHYQKKRIYTFLHPEADPKGSGWQTIQSMITVGSGGMQGKGLGQGTMTRLNFLPEHDTDFIFSVLAEEHGFLGASVVIGLFTAFLLRGLMFARDSHDMIGTLLATGAVTVLAFHIFVNIAITIGLMPVTGIPLPFLSYGGSFYMTTMMCVGVLLNVPLRRKLYH